VLHWLRAVVHQPLAPLGVSLAQLGEGDALLPEMEFWLPARQQPVTASTRCAASILPGQPRPACPSASYTAC
jgi:exodeoxyribonuclease V beta subunit